MCGRLPRLSPQRTRRGLAPRRDGGAVVRVPAWPLVFLARARAPAVRRRLRSVALRAVAGRRVCLSLLARGRAAVARNRLRSGRPSPVSASRRVRSRRRLTPMPEERAPASSRRPPGDRRSGHPTTDEAGAWGLQRAPIRRRVGRPEGRRSGRMAPMNRVLSVDEVTSRHRRSEHPMSSDRPPVPTGVEATGEAPRPRRGRLLFRGPLRPRRPAASPSRPERGATDRGSRRGLGLPPSPHAKRD